MRTRCVGRLQHRGGIGSHRRHRIGTLRHSGTSDSSIVEHEYPKMGTQVRGKPKPSVRRRTKSIDQQDGVALAFFVPPNIDILATKVRH